MYDDMCSFVAACSTWQLVVVGVFCVLCHCCILLMVYIVITALANKKFKYLTSQKLMINYFDFS